jgi:hypothetical protein
VRNVLLIISACFLAVTALSKLVLVIGSPALLNGYDKLLSQPERVVAIASSGLEVAIATYLTLGTSLVIRGAILAWLGLNFVVYHIFMGLIGETAPCACLGAVNRWLADYTGAIHQISITLGAILALIGLSAYFSAEKS